MTKAELEKFMRDYIEHQEKINKDVDEKLITLAEGQDGNTERLNNIKEESK